MNTATYLALPPQEQFAIVEEQIKKRRVLRDWPVGRNPDCGDLNAWEFADAQGKPCKADPWDRIPRITWSVVLDADQEWPPPVDEDGYAYVDLTLTADFDEPKGWWEIVAEMRRNGWKHAIEDEVVNPGDMDTPPFWVQFSKANKLSGHTSTDVACAVRVAALRAVGFLVD